MLNQVLREKRIPPWMEVALIPMTGKPSLYPGLFLFTTPCRLVRPVQNLELGREELIGTMEQVGTSCSVAYGEQLSEARYRVLKRLLGGQTDFPGSLCPALSSLAVLPRFQEPAGGVVFA